MRSTPRWGIRLRRRQGEWAHRSAADEAAEWRHRRGFDAGRAHSEPRLAELYEEPRARNKIKHWLNEHQRERAIEIGKKLLDREARKYKLSLNKFQRRRITTRIAGEYGVATQAELLAAIGFGKFSSRQVLNKLEPGSTMTQSEPAASDRRGSATRWGRCRRR